MATAKKKMPGGLADRQVELLAGQFGQFADKNRLKILFALALEGELHVTALGEITGQSQPAVSHHLTLLRMAGMVGSRRQGKFSYYSLDGTIFADLLEQVFAFAGKAGRIELDDGALTLSRVAKKR